MKLSENLFFPYEMNSFTFLNTYKFSYNFEILAIEFFFKAATKVLVQSPGNFLTVTVICDSKQ